MGTTKKPAPRRKRPATGKGKPAVKVQAPRPRKKKPAVQNIVLPPVAPGHYQQVEVPPAIISRIEPIPAAEIERRSEEVRAAARKPVVGEHGLQEDIDRNARAGDIWLTVLVIIVLIAIIAGLARSAV